MEPINKTLNEREKTHGRYEAMATAYSCIKDVFKSNWRPNNLGLPRNSRDRGRELALDAIAMKLARILAGNDECIDHWHDIAGYATLQAQQLEDAYGKGEE